MFLKSFNQVGFADVGVSLSCIDGSMAEKLLDDSNVCAVF